VVKKLIVPVLAAMLVAPAAASAAEPVDRGTARAALTRMEQASMQVTNLLNGAKASNDAVKFSCLNDKATQIKSVVNAASETFRKADGLTGAARNEAFAAVLADAETVEQLRNEATQCVGAAEAEQAKAKPGDALARRKAQEFDPLDPRSDASSLGGAGQSVLPAVQAPGAASPTR
jgi:hypothetical protein